MKRFLKSHTAQEIAELLDGKLMGEGSIELTSVSSLENADGSSICFLESPDYIESARSTKAGLLMLHENLYGEEFKHVPCLIVEKPMIAFMGLVTRLLAEESENSEKSVSGKATIHETAKIGGNVSIAPGVVIGRESAIGDGCEIGPNCVIGDYVKIGAGCKFFPNVTIYDECVLHDRVILHAGVVIGADGFGYVLMDGKQVKIPQVGNVIIHDDVEIGANSSVDRATLGSTVIGARTKLDNMVQVGHNVVIGEDSILCAQVGVAGSTRVGSRVYLAGQVGIGDHRNIGDEVMVGAQSGIAKDIPDGMKMFGSPAVEAIQQKRMYLSQLKLPDFMKETRLALKEIKEVLMKDEDES